MDVWTRRVAETRSRLEVGPATAPVHPGEYFHSERALFRVERCDEGRALVEDCRTGELVDLELRSLLKLNRLRR
jgi:hypothetical protein